MGGISPVLRVGACAFPGGGARTLPRAGGGGGILLAGACVLLSALAPHSAGAQGAGAGAGVGAFVPGPTGLALALETRLHHQVDELVSPLRYSGFGLGAGVRWGFSTEGGIRSLSASYGSPRLTSAATEGGSHYQEGMRGDARLLALQRVASFKDGRFTLFLGGAATVNFALYRHWYTREDKESWIHAFGLVHPGLGWSYLLTGGGLLWQEVTVPLAGVAFRPGYEGLTEAPKAAWAGPGDVGGVAQALHYLQPMGRRFRFGITYSFAGLSYSEPQPLTLTRQALSFFVTVWEGGAG